MNFVEQKIYDINSGDSKNFCIEENSNEFLSKYYLLINHYIGFYIENIYSEIARMLVFVVFVPNQTHLMLFEDFLMLFLFKHRRALSFSGSVVHFVFLMSRI